MVSEDVREIPLDQIKLPLFQPRQYFDEAAMQHLTANVKQHGILQPVLLRPLGENLYELVTGERRYRAAKSALLKYIPAVIKERNQKEALEIALLENIQREDLNAIEETEAILQLLALELELEVAQVPQFLYKLKRLADNYSLSNADSGQNVWPEREKGKGGQNVLPEHKSPDGAEARNIWAHPERGLAKVKSVFDGLNRMSWESFVKSRLSLLNLPSDLLDAVRTTRIKYTKAQAIAKIKDDEQRRGVLEQAIAEGWSLSKIKEHVKSLMGEKAAPDPDRISLLTRLDATYERIKKSHKKNSKIWQNHQTQKRLEALLTELVTIFFTEEE
ncbi:MAG: ParB/RepB/Spo0J family partition protein [Hormoscilla sp. GUM202]|nr:ParB/RepB/Spo0J family partition protein [Hormoscilla sp. GUM202]